MLLKKNWVCAPEDKQHIANQKATKLIDEMSSEQSASEVVIKPITIPKFDVEPLPEQPSSSVSDSTKPSAPAQTTMPRSTVADSNVVAQTNTESNNNQTTETKIRDLDQGNPYAELWSHQLIGLSTPQSAVNFVKQKRLDPEEVLIIKSVRAEMDWWIVLYGLYKDKQTGLDNEINLPSNLDKPWLRPLKNLKVFGFVEKF